MAKHVETRRMQDGNPLRKIKGGAKTITMYAEPTGKPRHAAPTPEQALIAEIRAYAIREENSYPDSDWTEGMQAAARNVLDYIYDYEYRLIQARLNR